MRFIIDEQGYMLDASLLDPAEGERWTFDAWAGPINHPRYQGGTADPETGEVTGGEWVGDALSVDWPAAIAGRRYQAEVAGIDVAGMHVDTDDRSKLLINGAALEAFMNPQYVMQWKTPGGFVELSAEQIMAVARAVRAHVQSCFDREAELLAALADQSFVPTMIEEGWPAG